MADPVELAHDYQDGLKKSSDQLRQTVQEAQSDIRNLPEQVKRKLQMVSEEVKEAFTDFYGGVGGQTPHFLLQCNMWVSVCLVALTIGELVGQNAFYAVTKGMFGSWAFPLFGFMVIPVIIWISANTVAEPHRDNADKVVLVAAAVLGLLLGTLISKKRTTFICPPNFIPHLGIACAAYGVQSAEAITQDRRVFVAVVLSPAVFVYGLMAYSMPGSIFAYAILLLGSAFVDLQLKIKYFQGNQLQSIHHEQWKSVVIMAVADVFAFLLLSESTD